MCVRVGFVSYGIGADISLPHCHTGKKVAIWKERRANGVQKRSHGPKSRDDSFGTKLRRHGIFQTFRQRMPKCLAFRYVPFPQEERTQWISRENN